MLLDLVFLVVFIFTGALVIMGVMSFLVSNDFFLPVFLRLIKMLGGSTGRVVVAICMSVEIIFIFAFAGGVALYLTRIGNAITDSRITQVFTATIRNLNAAAITVVIILSLMSIYSIAIMIERYLTYRAAKQQSREFAPRVAQALKNDRIREAINISDKHKRSHLAMVVNSGLQELRAHEGTSDISGDEIEASKRALQRAITIKTAEFRRGLSGLATIGSTAPFVGLFGTVFGIINAFQRMKNAEVSGLDVVAGSISEALFMTVLGLAVAVPSVWLFNYFTGKVDGFIVEMKNSASELIEYVDEHRARTLTSTSRNPG